MAEISHQFPESHPAAREATRIAQANGGQLGVSVAEAQKILAARGIFPPGADGKPVYTVAPKDPKPENYNIEPRTLRLPEGTDPATVASDIGAIGAALQLPPYMAPLLTQIAEQKAPVDPAQVEKTVERAGHDYAALIRDVDEMIAAARGRTITYKAAQMPAEVLIHLGQYHRLRKGSARHG